MSFVYVMGCGSHI